MFRRVLVANRGEIALRILRACDELGIETVAVYSEADRGAPWLENANTTICLGPARAQASYLDADAILQAAEQLECQAIHPGYGFLSENPVFAARCEQQGVTFVGPGADAIRTMGDKSEARRTMAAHGLPTIPGSGNVLSGPQEARSIAEEIGYPVLLKATAGGGGRGMRRCDDTSALAGAFEEAMLEAEKAFGNPGLYLEKYIEGGRHIEFQVLCDGMGAGVHLGERECSIQRQHQKLLEESPCPVMDPRTRDDLGGRIARAVAAIGYRNAGTVEFLRDGDGRLYFMEMNTRLQVEHPVTEMVTGCDLVREQLRIAAGHSLGVVQDQVAWNGHAIELRINAEDPAKDFRPDPGQITAFEPPTATIGRTHVRWDSAIRAGYRIPAHYDSMIGKLIVHGPDRPAAIAGARAALDTMRIDGVATTIGLHRRILDDPVFARGDYDIDFLATRS
ncbi:MAG: acetyl-CoA carboxylase biotin carboxylase subunit, partial [Acidobacteriota bacterium]|nr:acetyl-CoA carboxylase biotin carboxylase subunit [Acidobacteriota bacterium]